MSKATATRIRGFLRDRHDAGSVTTTTEAVASAFNVSRQAVCRTLHRLEGLGGCIQIKRGLWALSDEKKDTTGIRQKITLIEKILAELKKELSA